MDQGNTPPRTISYPAMASSSGSFTAPSSSARSPFRGATTSAMLSPPPSSSSSAHSHRRFHHSPYPPPAPFRGRLASGSDAGSGPSSRFRPIAPLSSPMVARGGVQRSTYPLPSSFLSELCSIRRVSASLSGDLDARATAAQQIRATLHGQESSSISRLGTPSLPSGSLSELGTPVSSSQQLQPLPDRTFSGFRSPPPLQQQPQLQAPQASSTSDLASQPSGSFSAGSAPACHTETTTLGSSSWSAQQAQPSLVSVSDPPLDHMSFCQPSGNDNGNSRVMQQPASDSELAPLPPTLHIPSLIQVKEEPMDDAPRREPVFISLDDDDNDGGLSALVRSFTSSSKQPSLPELGSGPSGSSSSRPGGRYTPAVEGREQSSEAAMTPVAIMYDKVNTVGSSSSGGGSNSITWNRDSSMSMSQQQTPPQFQPLSQNPPQNNTLLEFFQQQTSPNPQMALLPSSNDRQHQLNNSGGGTIPLNSHSMSQQQAPSQRQPSQSNTFSGFVQQEPTLQMPLLPSSIDRLQQNSSIGGSTNNPWNCHSSMSMSHTQLLAPQLEELFSSGFSDVTPQRQTSSNNTFPGLVQQQGNLQMPLMPSSTDKLKISYSSDGPSLWSAASTNRSGQGWEARPSVASKSISGGSMGIGQQGLAPGNNDSMFGTSGGGSSSSVWANRPWKWNLSCSPMDYSNAITMLRMGGMEKPSRLQPRPPSLNVGAGASSGMSRRDALGDLFSEAEMEAINKDKHLKKIVSTDPKRVKRILSNRLSVAKLNAVKINRVQDLERRSEALQMDCIQLSTQLMSHKATIAHLNARNSQMRLRLQMLNDQQASPNEALVGHLQSEIQSLQSIQHNMLRANGIHDPMRTEMAGDGSHADSLYPLRNCIINDSSGSHQLPTEVQPPQHDQQPHQAIDDEFVMAQQ